MLIKELMPKCVVKENMAIAAYGQGLALLGDLKNVRPELKPN